ncbi:MAG: 3-deoxy-D-manno-octulosonate 8-phosphate phosphatase [Prosthecochloris sp.]|nr:3-deoxy-D-manno-octulosonate 8-phosphate phosphatase [Prosthecochloris sp.]
MSGINYFGIQLSSGDHSQRLQDALVRVRGLLFPVEGVMAGGHMTFTASGEDICSCFVRDALAIREAEENGVKVAVVSDRRSPAVEEMLRQAGVRHAYLGYGSALEAYEQFKNDCGLEDGDCAYIADDIVDIPVLEKVLLSITPIDGVEYLRNRVSYISAYEGGKGCIREVIELILQQQGKWQYSDHCVM